MFDGITITGKDEESILNALDQIKSVYIGNNGLTASYTGGSGTVKRPHEAHRDLLARYTDYDESSIDGFTSLDTSHNHWRIRFWETEPKSLEDVLNKLQYEGGFIFTHENGSGRYIHIKDGYGSSDINATLKRNDISNIKISHLPISGVITKRKIEYHRHPAGKGYLDEVEITNPTVRSNYIEISGSDSKEGIKTDKLDYLVHNESIFTE